MKVRFLGACREVGRSAFAVQVGEKFTVLDYGAMVNHQIGFPMHIPPKDVEAVLLTHAHLDHSGSCPIFYVAGGVPIYSVEPTFVLTSLLVKDFLKLSGYYLPFEYLDLESLLRHKITPNYGEEIKLRNFTAKMINAGHIPGSSQIIVEADGRRLLYTGDFNRNPSRLVGAADNQYKDLDAIIIESTYAMEDHPDRPTMEKEFVSRVSEVVHRGGVCLVPAFGVGRSQELLCVLAAHHFEYPVFVDGMALDAMHLLTKFPNALGDSQLFDRATRGAQWIESWPERRKAAKTPSVIISPAGMLKGGNAVFYMENVASEKQNAIFLVSFQVPGSPGRILLDRRKFIIHGRPRPVDAEIERFDFSSHGGRRELEMTLSELDKKTKVYVVHGAEGNCLRLASWASKQLGLTAIAPKPGEIHEV